MTIITKFSIGDTVFYNNLTSIKSAKVIELNSHSFNNNSKEPQTQISYHLDDDSSVIRKEDTLFSLAKAVADALLASITTKPETAKVEDKIVANTK